MTHLPAADDRVREIVYDHLRKDRDLASCEIDVTVEDGTVRLKGRVPDAWSRRHAEEAAIGVSGVRIVQNDLLVERRVPHR